MSLFWAIISFNEKSKGQITEAHKAGEYVFWLTLQRIAETNQACRDSRSTVAFLYMSGFGVASRFVRAWSRGFRVVLQMWFPAQIRQLII